MIALQIENVKDFMSRLFQGDMFDKFHVNRAEVTTFITLTADGKKNVSWFDSDEEDNGDRLVVWRQLKPVIFSFIRGNKTPDRLEIDFSHYMKDGDMGSLRIQYSENGLFVYTGYMQREFVIDKGKQQAWDENCIAFIKKNQIISTLLK